MKKKKIAYISLTADTIHHGHMKLLEKAREYGDITIGLMTSSAVAAFKRIPILTFDQRKKILLNFMGVKKVIKQESWDYSQYIKQHKPDYLIHGDDWKVGYQKEIRDKVIKALKSYGGKLIEIPYTKGISSSALSFQLTSNSLTPDIRRNMLRRLIEAKPISRFIEAHSPLSALIGEKSLFEKKGKTSSFDGFWSSSLTDSTSKGKPGST